jgi:hypothetical protein
MNGPRAVPDRFPGPGSRSGSQAVPDQFPTGDFGSGTAPPKNTPPREPVPTSVPDRFRPGSQAVPKPEPGVPNPVTVPPPKGEPGNRRPILGAQELLDRIAALGAEVRVEGDTLRVRPGGVVSPEMLRDLRARKREILALLLPPRRNYLAEFLKAQGEQVCEECGVSMELRGRAHRLGLVAADGGITCTDCLEGYTALRRAGVPIGDRPGGRGSAA